MAPRTVAETFDAQFAAGGGSRAIEERRLLVGLAAAFLTKHYGLKPDDAHRLLRRQSMCSRIPLHQVAASVLSSGNHRSEHLRGCPPKSRTPKE